MTKKEILSTCYICNKKFKNQRSCSSHIINAHKQMRNIENKTKYFLKYISPLINNYTLYNDWKFNCTGKCQICGDDTKFVSMSKGFRLYCRVCRYSDSIIQQRKETCLKKYGVDSYSKTEECKLKVKQTNLKKYNTSYYSKTEEFKKKVNNTNLKLYGETSYSKTEECKEKTKKTNLQKYGVEAPMQNNIIKEKSKQTCLEKYGVIKYSKTEKCKGKVKQTCLEKYGVTNYTKTDKCKEKIVSTCLEKYGEISYSKTEEFKEKLKQTMLQKYGVEHPGKLIYYAAKEMCERKMLNTGYKIIKIFKKENTAYITFKHFSCNKINTLSRCMINKYLRENNTQICPHCYPRSISKGEQEIVSFIRQHAPDIKLILNSRTILPSGKELDIYIPDYNFAIEFNGMYWHSEQAGKDKKYHLNKTSECENLGIHLIHIFEDEWNNTKNIIKYKILNKLHLIKERVHTRKCTVRKLETKKEKELARRFLDLHHIQGRCVSSIYYGLIYNGIFVAIMSFSASRRNIFGDRDKNDSAELVRFASHLKYNIPGAASRLLKHFEREYKPDGIISYAHRRLTNINNNLYKKLGFKLLKISTPGYYYFDGEKRYHRYNFRKSILVEMGYDKEFTEFEITDMIGLLRIWDCGQLVYSKNLT